mmetsp:Transcript_4725/g.13951  ORF Transcript_4725/g.13951 Transcript_4725/m.13951 type:complete len:266 (-) Transcript_4725:1259-2056(-)
MTFSWCLSPSPATNESTAEMAAVKARRARARGRSRLPLYCRRNSRNGPRSAGANSRPCPSGLWPARTFLSERAPSMTSTMAVPGPVMAMVYVARASSRCNPSRSNSRRSPLSSQTSSSSSLNVWPTCCSRRMPASRFSSNPAVKAPPLPALALAWEGGGRLASPWLSWQRQRSMTGAFLLATSRGWPSTPQHRRPTGQTASGKARGSPHAGSTRAASTSPHSRCRTHVRCRSRPSSTSGGRPRSNSSRATPGQAHGCFSEPPSRS